jgi:hypothetical protein
VEEKEMNFDLPNIPIGEDELIGDSVAVATVTCDEEADDLDVLLGRAVDVNAIVARVAAPSRTPIDFAKLASFEDLESFDASENILDDIATPEIPPYVRSPGTVDAPVFAKRHQASTKKFRAPDGINVGENTARKVVSENGRFVCEYDASGELLRGYELMEAE